LARVLSEPVGLPAGGRWSDFGVRLGSALVLGPLALAALWHGGWAWSLLIAIALTGLGYEWSRLAGGKQAGQILLPFGLLATMAITLTGGFPAGFIALLILTLIAWRAGGLLLAGGVPYAGIGGLSLLWLRLQGADGFDQTLFLVVVIWATDIGAYLVGRVVGGAKLAPKISPGKTWSGSVGGLLIGGLSGALLAVGFHGLDLAALGPALGLSIFAQAGDLLESAIKRRLGVKDSGHTIPGHGGLFDRLDGFLAAAPLAALIALGLQGGWHLWP
jgi:phosphatidate cytidylyltransferase